MSCTDKEKIYRAGDVLMGPTGIVDVVDGNLVRADDVADVMLLVVDDAAPIVVRRCDCCWVMMWGLITRLLLQYKLASRWALRSGRFVQLEITTCDTSVGACQGVYLRPVDGFPPLPAKQMRLDSAVSIKLRAGRH